MFKSYLICGQKIRIEAPFFPTDCSDWQLFETQTQAPDISVNCVVSENLPEVSGSLCGNCIDFAVYSENETIFRKRQMGIAEGCVSKFSYIKGSDCEVYFTPHSFPVLMDSRYFWGSVPLAQLLLPKKAVFMHASYIDVGGSAVLFSAPSGTGKSTQAELWRVHRNAEVINGDKSGIRMESGKAYACGLPFCGTSKICKNRTLPLKAIVILNQGKENIVKRLTGVAALQGVVNNIYLDLLAPSEKQMCIDVVIEILENVPVFSLECTPDERAVEALEKLL